MNIFLSRITKLSIIVTLIILIITGISIAWGIHKLHKIGWTLKEDETVIEITDPEYSAGMDSWETMDYADAERHLRNALQTENDKMGNGSVEAAAVSQELGALLLEMGKYEESYECLSSAYVTFKNELGERDGHSILAGAMIAVYDIKTGDLERGFASLSDLFDNASYYKTKVQIGELLAQCYTELGDYKRAIDIYEALGNLYSYFDIKTVGTVTLLNDYGVLMLKVGNYQKALDSLNAAVSTWEELGLQNNNLIASVYSNLAMACEYNNNIEQAKEYHLKALDIQVELYGENSVFSAMAYNAMSDMYGMEGNVQEEKRCLDTALDAAKQSVGINHNCTAMIYLNLGDYHKTTGDLEKAAECHKQALEIRKNMLEVNNIETAAVYEALSDDYRKENQHELSIENAERAIEIYESLFGRDNINSAHGYIAAAWANSDAGNRDRAQELVETAIRICDRQNNNAGVVRAYAYQTKGYVLMQESKADDAIESLRKSVRFYEEFEGENSRNVITTYLFLGDAYQQSGDNAEYLNCLLTAKEKSDKLKGTQDLIEETESKLHELYDQEGSSLGYDEWLHEKIDEASVDKS